MSTLENCKKLLKCIYMLSLLSMTLKPTHSLYMLSGSVLAIVLLIDPGCPEKDFKDLFETGLFKFFSICLLGPTRMISSHENFPAGKNCEKSTSFLGNDWRNTKNDNFVSRKWLLISTTVLILFPFRCVPSD